MQGVGCRVLGVGCGENSLCQDRGRRPEQRCGGNVNSFVQTLQKTFYSSECRFDIRSDLSGREIVCAKKEDEDRRRNVGVLQLRPFLEPQTLDLGP